jgi:Mg/Co/Ni transporter MgtE
VLPEKCYSFVTEPVFFLVELFWANYLLEPPIRSATGPTTRRHNGTVNLEQSKDHMSERSLNEADELLDQWPFIRKHERLDRFEGLPREQRGNFFLELDAKSQAELVLALPEGVRRLYIRELAPDDGIVTFGTLTGSMLPFILRRCGLDPASASAPFVATLVDVTGIIIYFSVAKLILTGTVL